MDKVSLGINPLWVGVRKVSALTKELRWFHEDGAHDPHIVDEYQLSCGLINMQKKRVRGSL